MLPVFPIIIDFHTFTMHSQLASHNLSLIKIYSNTLTLNKLIENCARKTMQSTCTLCKSRNASYSRPYSGEKLCTRCFCKSIETKVRGTIAKHEMLRFDDQIAMGLSGGKDSMTLLSMLSKLEKSFPKTKLVAITIDEGIQEYRDEALKISEKACRKLGIEQIIVSFEELFGYNLDEMVQKLHNKTDRKSGFTPCAYCGVLRRRALNTAARDWGATKLATAHNLDDEIQTMLINIMHGDPLRIVRGNPVTSSKNTHFVRRIKPLSEILEKETTFYAFQKKIQFQDIPCPHSTIALRNDVRAMLNRMEENHPGLKYTVYRSVEKLEALAENMPHREQNTLCRVCNEPAANDICQPCKMMQSFERAK